VLGDLVGDWYLFGRLLRLGSARNPRPLITLSEDQTSIRHTEAVLTPFGAEVLKGRASNYPANPIDDWAAGVRLSSEGGALWFNDGGKLIRAKPSAESSADHLDEPKQAGAQLRVSKEELTDLANDAEGG
jgi:hypothetical protein